MWFTESSGFASVSSAKAWNLFDDFNEQVATLDIKFRLNKEDTFEQTTEEFKLKFQVECST
jgi:hypothetical protein